MWGVIGGGPGDTGEGVTGEGCHSGGKGVTPPFFSKAMYAQPQTSVLAGGNVFVMTRRLRLAWGSQQPWTLDPNDYP